MRNETGRNGFASHIRQRIEREYEGCLVVHLDPNDVHQGIPDFLILYRNRWAMLEVKKSRTAKRQPNQQYWVDHYDRMSFAAVIYPENEELIYYAMEHTLKS